MRSRVTAHQAPHKPLLLLCVLGLFDSGKISSNLIEITDDLTELFGRYWERVLTFDRPGNLALSFFHLQGDGFWRLLPRHEVARIGTQITSLARLRAEVIGARLDEELYDLVRSGESRDRLRDVLIETDFSPETRPLISGQGAINRGAFLYSEELLGRPEDTRVEETLPVEETYRPAVRDQGFRRAVVTILPHSHQKRAASPRRRTRGGPRGRHKRRRTSRRGRKVAEAGLPARAARGAHNGPSRACTG